MGGLAARRLHQIFTQVPPSQPSHLNPVVTSSEKPSLTIQSKGGSPQVCSITSTSLFPFHREKLPSLFSCLLAYCQCPPTIIKATRGHIPFQSHWLLCLQNLEQHLAYKQDLLNEWIQQMKNCLNERWEMSTCCHWAGEGKAKSTGQQSSELPEPSLLLYTPSGPFLCLYGAVSPADAELL